MNDNEKLPEGELTPQSEFGKKLDNFWYYNKWKVLAGLFALFVLIVCLVQCATRENTDVALIYGGALSASDSRTQDMRAALSALEPEAVGKNGVGLTVMEVYDEEYAANNSDKVHIPTNNSNYDSLCQLITAGEYSVLILDRWIYDEIKGRVGFRAVDEICGEALKPEQKLDANAVIFKKTAFYGANAGAFSGVSDDAVICLCIYSPFKTFTGCGGSENVDRDYQNSVEMFKAIVTYGN